MKRAVQIAGGSYLRIRIATVLILIGLSSCGVVCKFDPSEWEYCRKEVALLNATSAIPYFALNASLGSDSIRKQLNQMFDSEYLLKNPKVEVAIPLGFYNRNYFLHVNLVHGSKVIDSNTPKIQSLPESLLIGIDQRNEVMVNGDFSVIDSISNVTRQYYKQIGENENYPETYNEARIFVKFEKCSQSFFHTVVELVCHGYLESLVEKTNRELCRLSNKRIKQLRSEYPLRISIVMEPEF